MAAMGALLITGYVLLAAVGRDTTGYVLFLGGPAMTSIVGAVLTRRLSHVQQQVTTVQVAAAVALDDEATAIHQHLSEQDNQLATLTQAVATSEPAPAPAAAGGKAGLLPAAPGPGSPSPGLPSQRAQAALGAVWPVGRVGRRPDA